MEDKREESIYKCGCDRANKLIGENYCRECLNENPFLCT